jgi:hypothetical protein
VDALNAARLAKFAELPPLCGVVFVPDGSRFTTTKMLFIKLGTRAIAAF